MLRREIFPVLQILKRFFPDIFLFTNIVLPTIIVMLVCYELTEQKKCAGVSELADETDSKSVVREGVWVRVPPPAVKNRDPIDRTPVF